MKTQKAFATVYLPDRQYDLYRHELVKRSEPVDDINLVRRALVYARRIARNFKVKVKVVVWNTKGKN